MAARHRSRRWSPPACGATLAAVLCAALSVAAPAAADPTPAALRPGGQRAYVLSLASPSLTVLDTANDRPIGTIPVGENPLALAVAPDGQRVYVVGTEPNRLVIIDTATEREIHTTRLSSRPAALAVASDGGRVFVVTAANRNDFHGQIETLDARTGGLVSETAYSGFRPRQLIVGAGGTRLYISGERRISRTGFLGLGHFESSGEVAAYDVTHDDRQVWTVTFRDASPVALALSDDGRRLYDAEYEGVRVLDPATGGQISRLRSPTVLDLVVDPAHPRVFVLTHDHGVQVFRDGDEFPQRAFAMSKDTGAIALTAGGGELLGADRTSRVVSMVDADTGRERRTIPVDSRPTDIDLLPAFAPAVTTEPDPQTVNAGQRAQFTATANGNPGPRVDWQVSRDGGASWSEVAGADAPTYSLKAKVSNEGSQYRAVFSNHRGHASTRAATLTVVKPTPVLDWPAPAPLRVGSPLPATDLDARAESPPNVVAEPAPPTSGPPPAAEVSGTYRYRPPAGSILPAGTDELTVTFTPTDTRNYNPATVTVPIRVQRPHIAPSSRPCTAHTGLAYLVPRRLRARSTRILAARVIDSAGRPVRVAHREGWRIIARLNGLPAGLYRLRVVLRAGRRERTFTTAPTRCSTFIRRARLRLGSRGGGIRAAQDYVSLPASNRGRSASHDAEMERLRR
jgi:YVTN family beta-propeller protein